MRRIVFVIGLAALSMTSCTGTTGDQLISFNAFAAGAKGAGDPFTVNGCFVSPCPSSEVFTVQLTLAQMFVGALYVNEAPAGSGGTFNTPSCISPGIYVAQVPEGAEVNLMDTTPQAFHGGGNGTADLGLSWELYLTDGDVNNPDNSGFGIPNTADLAGTATRESDGEVFSWAATININQANRGVASSEPGQPGLNPICLKRIVNLGGISIQFFQGGQMSLAVDPRGWFKLPIDFSTLPSVSSPQCGIDQNSMYGQADFCIPDSSNLPGAELGSQQGINLYTGLFTGGNSAFTLSYTNSP